MFRHAFFHIISRVRGPLLAFVCGMGVLLLPHLAMAQPKGAIVDIRRAVWETEDGLRVKATLTKLFDRRQVDLDKLQRGLAEQKDKLDQEAQSGKTADDVLQRKYELWQRKYFELQNIVMSYQREMQYRERELTNPILQKILAILQNIAVKEGYERVSDTPLVKYVRADLALSAVPYFRSELDLTDRVIQMYNSGHTGDTNNTPAPQQPAPPAAPKTPAPDPKDPPVDPKKK